MWWLVWPYPIGRCTRTTKASRPACGTSTSGTALAISPSTRTAAPSGISAMVRGQRGLVTRARRWPVAADEVFDAHRYPMLAAHRRLGGRSGYRCSARRGRRWSTARQRAQSSAQTSSSQRPLIAGPGDVRIVQRDHDRGDAMRAIAEPAGSDAVSQSVGNDSRERLGRCIHPANADSSSRLR